MYSFSKTWIWEYAFMLEISECRFLSYSSYASFFLPLRSYHIPACHYITYQRKTGFYILIEIATFLVNYCTPLISEKSSSILILIYISSPMLLLAFLYAILCLPMLKAHSPTKLIPVRLLDSLLQEYAFRALFDQPPITGVVFDANVPSNLTGIEVSALRLRSGSLRERGFHSYKEFHIPTGVVEQPFVERLALVYHNLGNWSSLYYPLPGYTFLTPVVGLLAYDASTLSATNEPEILDIRASEKPIVVSFPNAQLTPDKGSPKCVYFDLYGSVEFDNVLRGNACSAIKQGHFSMVVELITASSPAPAVDTGVPPSSNGISSSKGKHEEFIVVGFVVGGVLLVMLLAIWVRKCRRRERIQRMEEEAQGGVPLSMTIVESVKLPVANATRTKPTLENEYVPFSDFS